MCGGGGGAAFNAKYLSRIDKFNKRAYKYGYTSNLITINDKIKERDRKLWGSTADDWNHILQDLLPPQRQKWVTEEVGGIILSYLGLIPNVTGIYL